MSVTTPLAAAGLTIDVVPDFVGLGVGSATQWMGAKDRVIGVQFHPEKSQREGLALLESILR